MESRTAFAPATVANVTVGFDLLGYALDGVGDRVTVTRASADPHAEPVIVESIAGVVTDLPTEPTKNTAAVALAALLERLGVPGSFRLALDKGIPLGSGMGGSAASAVAAVVAGHELLGAPLPREELLEFAVRGEAAASGAAHADNAAPSLLGGLVAVVAGDPLTVAPIPLPEGLWSVLVHPHLTIETREARKVLPANVPLASHTRQSMRLAGFLAGCFRGDVELMRRSWQDEVVEPRRGAAIPGFEEARRVALERGAIGAGIAGSGPSLYALTPDEESGTAVATGVVEVLERHGLASDRWVAPVDRRGAYAIEQGPA